MSLKQAAAHIDEEGVREGLIQSPAALLNALCLQQASLQQLVELLVCFVKCHNIRKLSTRKHMIL